MSESTDFGQRPTNAIDQQQYPRGARKFSTRPEELKRLLVAGINPAGTSPSGGGSSGGGGAPKEPPAVEPPE